MKWIYFGTFNKNDLRKPLLLIEDDTKLNFDNFAEQKTDYDSIVIGYSPTYLDYKHLNLAYQLLLTQPNIQENSKSREVSVINYNLKLVRTDIEL